jgi:hypothetical protein
MKARKVLILVLFLPVTFLLSCKKEEFKFPDPSTLPSGLIGTWLEKTLRSDTIIFQNNEISGSLLLKNNFNNMSFTMAYPYQISGDSIFVKDPTSSSSEIADGLNFYFKLDDPKRVIDIGNFTYRLITKNQLLTFQKLK